METPNADQGSTTHGRRTLKIVATALLRAGIKAVPLVGSALDQATFGVKDAFSSAEVRDILSRMLSILEHYRMTPVAADKESQHIVAELMDHPEASELIARLDTASACTRMVLAKVLMELENQLNSTNELMIDVHGIVSSVEDATHQTLELVRDSHSRLDAQYSQIKEALNAISEALDGPRVPPERTLFALFRLLDDLETAPLQRAARAVRSSLQHFSRSAGAITVDFAVMHQYAYAPFRRNVEQSFSVAAFHISRQPVYILPGTIREVNNFLTHAYNGAS